MDIRLNAKEYLMTVENQKYRCEQIADDLHEAEIDAYGLSAVTMGERVQTSSSPEWKINAAVEEVNRLKKVYEEEVAQYIAIRREVRTAIRQINNRNHEKVLEMRYCKFMRLHEIAQAIDKKEGYVRRIHGDALENFRSVHHMK